MNEKEPTWFGINLNQKQTVYIFFFAIIGTLIAIFVFITFLTSILMSFYWMVNDSYYDPEYFLISMLSSYIPTLSFFGILLSICGYSMSRCRKISAYFRELNPSPSYKSSSLMGSQTKGADIRYNSNKQMFCAECGTPRGESQQFCVNCGSKFN